MNETFANFTHRLRDLAHRYGLPAFWRWWMAELAPLVPAKPRVAIKRRRLRPVLAFGRDEVVLWEPQIVNGTLGYGEGARIPLAGDAAATVNAGRAAIDGLPHIAYGGAITAANVIVALPKGQVLRKRLTLPAAVEPNLRESLSYDLDRHTPFKPDELYFDAVVIGRDSQRREITVDWMAALKSVVDQARRQAESWGATVVAVTPDAGGGSATPVASKLNLLPPGARPETAWWRRWHVWAPLAAVGVAALIAIALPIWQKRDYAIALSRITEQARREADAASVLRQRLETMAGDYNYVLSRKYAFPSAVDIVENVTKLMPDDTWLTQFEVKSQAKGKDLHREMLLRGESANAGRLVSLLEDSKLFSDAAPRSPTTKIQPGPGEIFDLGAQIVSAPPPQPLQLASAPGAAPSTQVMPTPTPSATAPAATPQPTATPASSAAPAAPPAATPQPTTAPPPAAAPPTATSAPAAPTTATPAAPTTATPAASATATPAASATATPAASATATPAAPATATPAAPTTATPAASATATPAASATATPAASATATPAAPATATPAAPTTAKDPATGLRTVPPGESPGVTPVPLAPGFGPPRPAQAPPGPSSLRPVQARPS